MKSPLSEPSIDIESLSIDEQERRIVPPADRDAVELDGKQDTVRIERTPRAQTKEREMLQQPWMSE